MESAQTLRISGAIGTTERESGRTKTRPYVGSSPPNRRNAGTAIKATPPSTATRAKRAFLALQQETPTRKTQRKSTRASSLRIVSKNFHGADAATFGEPVYYVEVKLRGAGTFIQRMPRREFVNLYRETYGTEYAD